MRQLHLRNFLQKIRLRMVLPIFCSKPVLLVGIPVLRAKFLFAAVIPKNVFQLKPPLFTNYASNQSSFESPYPYSEKISKMIPSGGQKPQSHKRNAYQSTLRIPVRSI